MPLHIYVIGTADTALLSTATASVTSAQAAYSAAQIAYGTLLTALKGSYAGTNSNIAQLSDNNVYFVVST